MHSDYRDLLKPEVINSISGLELIARLVVDNFLSGLNHSRRVGAGMEFSQYRAYEPGDDLRLLDWKMLARSGRYYVKQAEIETNVTVKFIIDSSESMAYEENGLTKLEFSKVIAASLGYLSHKQGDALGLFSLNDKSIFHLQPEVRKQHYLSFLQKLSQIQNQGKWPKNPAVLEKFHDHSHREMIFLITDLYEYDTEISNLINSLKSPRNEIIVIHLMGRKEIEFDYSGTVILEDLETKQRIKVNAAEARKKYLLQFNEHLKKLKDDFLASNIHYHLFSMEDDLNETLQFFLKNRTSFL
ncbi:DUF58 domain-containing protein [Gramella sp. BOM4]|nr:DUF58 domain-containing protein [Christiangramia bathymodioli]